MKENFEQNNNISTPERLRTAVDKAMDLLVNTFNVEGKEELVNFIENNPDTKFIIASSHFSNLDAPAAVKALGDKLNIQITTESVLFGLTPQMVMFKVAGEENFSPLEYKKEGKQKSGVFNPDDFDNLSKLMENNKTPWIAIHPFNTKEAMTDARIGSVYLAHKTGAKIIPTALELKGGSVSLEGIKEFTKGFLSKLKGKTEATFHIGDIMDVPDIDVSIIDEVLRKRANGEKISPEERDKFKQVMTVLRNEASILAGQIAHMLPEENRGVYSS